MSCGTGGDCGEPIKRNVAIVVLVLMGAVFFVLSGLSFIKDRGQAVPSQVDFGQYSAIAGKKVFQAYNCMDCHTLVGNGAYFAPDLTKEYESVGPAWLAAFLPSAGSWPTETAVRTQLLTNAVVEKAAGVTDLKAYYGKFPGAQRRIERRGGQKSFMPDLPFTQQQIGDLIAYLKYTSDLNTEGWPPKIETGSLAHRLTLIDQGQAPTAAAAPAVAAVAAPASSASAAPASGADLAKQGEALVAQYGCTSCHSTDDKRIVGPPWGKLYGSVTHFTDGSSLTVDEAYLTEHILNPNTRIPVGYPANVMPDYGKLMAKQQAQAIAAYIRSLREH
ncbi:MAG TPA: c-type cytochrome [Rhodanobacteraceae bacterium]|nr:c-type cytochrome [Rhodanobacteraceae bacterium]